MNGFHTSWRNKIYIWNIKGAKYMSPPRVGSPFHGGTSSSTETTLRVEYSCITSTAKPFFFSGRNCSDAVTQLMNGYITAVAKDHLIVRSIFNIQADATRDIFDISVVGIVEFFVLRRRKPTRNFKAMVDRSVISMGEMNFFQAIDDLFKIVFCKLRERNERADRDRLI